MATENGSSNSAQFEEALKALTSRSADEHALKTLANGTRQTPELRSILGSKNNLRHLIDTIHKTPKSSTITLDSALRCIGNACADNNEARDTMSSLGFTWATSCLKEGSEEIKILTTKVLFNVCSDHEACQQQCYRELVLYELITFLHTFTDEESNSCAVDLLLWTTGQKATVEPQLHEPLPKELLGQLIDLPGLYKEADVETYVSIIESVFCFIRDPTVQKQIVIDDFFPAIATKKFGSIVDRPRKLDPSTEQDAEDLKLLLPLGTSLEWCLSDIAALPEFAKAYQLDHPAIRHLIDYIQVRNTDQWAIGKSDHWKKTSGVLLTTCCEVVGNLLWALPSESYGNLVEEEHLEKPLFAEIVRAENAPESAAMMHSVVGLLIHLSRPSPKVREKMGSDQSALPTLERLCRHGMQQIKQDGAKLLRALGKECPVNQKRFAELGAEIMASLMEEQKKAADTEPS